MNSELKAHFMILNALFLESLVRAHQAGKLNQRARAGILPP